jgi:alpha-1,2-mannosyltransferase
MLKRVREQRPSYNNDKLITSSIAISSFKLFYYHSFAILYGLVGQCTDSVLVNSTWTKTHIAKLWKIDVNKCKNKLSLVFPPCNTMTLERIELSRPLIRSLVKAQHCAACQEMEKEEVGALLDRLRDKVIVLSIGQFRREKDHFLQLRYMNCTFLLSSYPNPAIAISQQTE